MDLETVGTAASSLTEIGPTSRIIAVIFALEREAAPFRRVVAGHSHVHIVVSGIGCARARGAVDRVVASAPGLVIAAGFCGALQTGLAVGDVICPAEVADAAGRTWKCHPLGLGISASGRLLTENRLVATCRDKLELGVRHQALAVDMESATIAEVCAPARDPVPGAACGVGRRGDGVVGASRPFAYRWSRVGVAHPAASMRRPSLLGEFRRLARDTRIASRNLASALQDIAKELHPLDGADAEQAERVLNDAADEIGQQ